MRRTGSGLVMCRSGSALWSLFRATRWCCAWLLPQIRSENNERLPGTKEADCFSKPALCGFFLSLWLSSCCICLAPVVGLWRRRPMTVIGTPTSATCNQCAILPKVRTAHEFTHLVLVRSEEHNV